MTTPRSLRTIASDMVEANAPDATPDQLRDAITLACRRIEAQAEIIEQTGLSE